MDSKNLEARIADELGSTPGREGRPALHPPPRVADHELVRRIGAGSYGEVWLARAVTGQWRAVKAVSRDRFSSDRPYEREFRGVIQFEPISRSHASLVQVLHVGRDDAAGAFYYVMELGDAVPGSGPDFPPEAQGVHVETYSPRTLRSDLKARGRLTVAESVALGVELAGALGHVHRHGLVHRDVKPSNVIFVQGRPKLADLGLVTSTDEARSFVGTEGFIPPEGPGSVKADLFALGRLLYEAVTGKDRCEFPDLPTDLDTWPNREEFLEFNEVVTQLCAPDPERRYANAAEVAGDLNLILAGRSVRRANGIERRLEQARRITVMTLIGLALLAGVVWFQQMRKREAENRAAQERALRERAEKAEREGQQQLYTALIEQARATVRGGEIGQRVKALDAVRRAAAITNTAELRREALTALSLPDLRWERDYPLVRDFNFSEPDPGFERIAVSRGTGPVEIRAFSDFAVIVSLPAGTNLRAFAAEWSADGRYLWVKRDREDGGLWATVEVWETSSPPRRALVIPDARYNAWCFHPERAEITAAIQSGIIASWDLATGRELVRVEVDGLPERIKYAPDGKSIAAASFRPGGWVVSIHDAGKVEPRVSHVFTATARNIAWHPRGRWLAVTDLAGGVHLMDPVTGEVRLLGRHRAEAATAVFDPRGEYLFTGGWEMALICWDLRTMRRAFDIPINAFVTRARADGGALVMFKDSGLSIYGFERPEVLRELVAPQMSRVLSAAFSPDVVNLAVSTDAGVHVWNLRTGTCASTPAAGLRLFWSTDGAELLGSSSSGPDATGGATYRWRVNAGSGPEAAPMLEALPMPLPQRFTSFSVLTNRIVWTTRDGSRLASTDALDPGEGGWIRTSRGINGQSPDGKWLGIYIPYSSRLQIYQMPEFKHVAVITNAPRITGFSFSPSGRELVVVSRGHAEVFRTGTWEHLRGVTNVVGLSVIGALYQPDERALWMADDLRSAQLRDVRTFEPLLPLPNGTFPLALSPDGRQLAVSVDARRVHILDLQLARVRLRELGLDWEDAGGW